MFFKKKKPRPSYQPRKTNWMSPRLVGFTLIGIALIFLLFAAALPQGRTTNLFSRIFVSPLSVLQNIRHWSTESYQSFLANFHAKEELAELRDEIEALRRENIELKLKLQRHDAYRAALNLPNEAEYQTLPAIVMAHDRRLHHEIIINRGLSDGLLVNMPVWTAEGLVGRTRRLNEHFSSIQLITDPGSAVGVMIENTPYHGILRGADEENRMLLTDLHLTQPGAGMREPEVGQAVLTSGAGMVFPRGLVAGHIVEASEEGTLRVAPAVTMSQVKAVYVYTNTSYRSEFLSLLTGE
mgnify:CR=1 FL=1